MALACREPPPPIPYMNKISLCIHKFPALVTAVLAALCALTATALPLDRYAAESRLASGDWVKISVDESSMYLLTESRLRQLGFSDPSKVRVFGYGGDRLPEVLDETTYADDLPEVPSVYVAGKGVVFYGRGSKDTRQTVKPYRAPSFNPFTLKGYYFISDGADGERLAPAETATAGVTAEATETFISDTWHKEELVSPGECGHLLVGEDFRYNPRQEFRVTLPGLVATEPVYFEGSFVANSPSYTYVYYTLNGKEVSDGGFRVAMNSDSHTHGAESVGRVAVDLASESVTVGVRYTGGAVSLANLNYFNLSYTRRLEVSQTGVKPFRVAELSRNVRLSGAAADQVVWDVTSPATPMAVRAARDGQALGWRADYATERTYITWSPSGTLPEPAVEGRVANQNLHALGQADMVIFTFADWRDQAESLAEFHRNSEDSLSVTVLTPDEIYNEFSSGSPDVQAFRKLLKMMYDRQAATGRPLRYALFMSRVTFDNRRITPGIKALRYPTMPAWFTDLGMSDNSAYTSDDMVAFLEDGSGRDYGRDRLSIALGRLPVTSATEARDAVDKIISYSTKSPRGNWRNNVLMLADDLDGQVHMKQAERQLDNMLAVSGGQVLPRKIYVDQYDLISGTAVQGRTDFYRALDEGMMWWSYIGHASPTALTAEGIVTYADLNGLYLRHFPVIYAATCNFLRWDASQVSGAELLFANPHGGVAAAISATRPVYIADNGYLSEAFGRYAFERDADGRLHTVGDIYRLSKNNFLYNGQVTSNTNKLRYVLLGDPAMRLAMPSQTMVIDAVNGEPVVGPDADEGEPTTLKARQQVKIEGRVLRADGEVDTGFTGIVASTLYDAEMSRTTQGHENNDPYTYTQIGNRLFVGNDSVTAGRFTINISMPAEVADNYRPAALNMFAYTDDGSREAVGLSREFYVYGIDTEAAPDNVPPVIESCYLNHSSFRNGQTVNPSPMLVATVTDDRAINLSTAGVGHQMMLSLDNGAKVMTDVSDFYTPFTDGTPGGTIAYPLENLTEGAHSLMLRVWDTSPNSASATIDFFVANEIAPVIYDVYTDTNPASVEANFYISHDRPDRQLTVTIEVYDLMGRRVWQKTETARSDMFSSTPVTWDLTDSAGRRVGRGIYLYRATVSDETSGDETATASRKLAVTAQ